MLSEGFGFSFSFARSSLPLLISPHHLLSPADLKTKSYPQTLAPAPQSRYSPSMDTSETFYISVSRTSKTAKFSSDMGVENLPMPRLRHRNIYNAACGNDDSNEYSDTEEY